MNTGKTPVSRTRVILTWTAVVLFVAGMCGFWMWWFARRTPSSEAEAAPGALFAIVMAFFGVVSLGAGIAAYAVTIYTNCLTFDFSKPVWRGLKTKIYFANIVVPLGWAMGLGFLAAGFLGPLLTRAGLNRGLAIMGPVMAMIFILQIAQLWILVWGPLETRIIQKRSAALGIAPEQLQTAFLVGLSDPSKSSLRKLGLVEEDVGALWVGPDQLIYWGDGEQFGLTREQVLAIERKMDSGSTSALAGVAHVILHVEQTADTVRLIRLHNEGPLTLGRKRQAMEQLAQAIEEWHRQAPGPA